jgi:thioredoxin-like negative regulator of GroEL
LLRQALEGGQHKPGNDHPACFESMHELAVLYKEQGRYEEAEKYLLEVTEGRRLKLGDKHPRTTDSLNNLIDLYKAWNKPGKTKEWRAKLSQTEAEIE